MVETVQVEVEDKPDNSPIFVVGTPRSGTTLTASVLGNHSRIFMPAETHFFDDIYSRREELGDPSDPASMRRIVDRLSTLYRRQHEGGYQKQHRELFRDPVLLGNRIGACCDYRHVLSRFVEIQMRAAGKVRWGNQVPRDIFNVTDILSFYPNAKIIVCIRDVRDFLLSYRGMKNVVPPRHVARQRRIYHPVVTSLLWRATVKQIPAVRQQVPCSNLLIVRYEDLVRTPEAVARQICGIIGEEFEPQMLAVRENNSSAGSSREKATGIFDSSVGRWHSALPSEHAFLGQLVAGKDLHDLGYQEERIEPSLFKVALIFLSFPFALLRGLYANRSKQGALMPYLAKRITSLVRPSLMA